MLPNENGSWNRSLGMSIRGVQGAQRYGTRLEQRPDSWLRVVCRDPRRGCESSAGTSIAKQMPQAALRRAGRVTTPSVVRKGKH